MSHFHIISISTLKKKHFLKHSVLPILHYITLCHIHTEVGVTTISHKIQGRSHCDRTRRCQAGQDLEGDSKGLHGTVRCSEEKWSWNCGLIKSSSWNEGNGEGEGRKKTSQAQTWVNVRFSEEKGAGNIWLWKRGRWQAVPKATIGKSGWPGLKKSVHLNLWNAKQRKGREEGNSKAT